MNNGLIQFSSNASSYPTFVYNTDLSLPTPSDNERFGVISRARVWWFETEAEALKVAEASAKQGTAAQIVRRLTAVTPAAEVTKIK